MSIKDTVIQEISYPALVLVPVSPALAYLFLIFDLVAYGLYMMHITMINTDDL